MDCIDVLLVYAACSCLSCGCGTMMPSESKTEAAAIGHCENESKQSVLSPVPIVQTESGPLIVRPTSAELAALLQLDAKHLTCVVPTDDCKGVFDAIDKAKKRYPPGFIDNHLQRIAIVEQLSINGVPYGGTYGPSLVVIVVNDEAGNPKSAFGLEYVFHAELSSLLLSKYNDRFMWNDWMSVNPEHFQYNPGGGLAAIRGGQYKGKGSIELYNSGFLIEYSKASAEEDLNSMAACIMIPDPSLIGIIAEYPRIRQKFNLLLGFYAAIDPAFGDLFLDPGFFESNVQDRESQE